MVDLKDQLSGFSGQAGDALVNDDGSVNLNAKGAPPTEEELQYEVVAPGEDALLPVGIAYVADWQNHFSGMGHHARQQVDALAMTGLPLRLVSLAHRALFTEDRHPDVRYLEYLEGVTSTRTLLSIKHLILDSASQLRSVICPRTAGVSDDLISLVYRNTIIYTSWERSTVPSDIVEVLRLVGQVWVPCERNAQVFRGAGLSNVVVIPYPFNPATCTIAAPRGREEVPAGRRYYNIGKWEPRKNQHRLIGAFLLAHTPQDRASLFIKTTKFGGNWANYPNYTDSVDFWLNDPVVKERGWTSKSVDRLVRIVPDVVDEAEIQKIHATNNIYVSPSAGEAWDIPAFDAKCAGNRLVHVGYGGSEDYAAPGDIQTPSRLVPVHPEYGWEEEAQWASCTVEELASAMLAAEIPSRRVMPNHLVRDFGMYAVAERMKSAIVSLARANGWEEDLLSCGGFG
jgi:glycosyltransferase involved in cell wall biosynthesis